MNEGRSDDGGLIIKREGVSATVAFKVVMIREMMVMIVCRQ